ncbi:MAG TPA: CPBP family intramembrane glutamic endopeptidase [Ktedonobacterales bacterium]|jgi:membrane protease YdiL (CAAX protease family)|nr:CPBP family intramembrane glutamic endopeptidase [Ktedonobacterales bacterium]
MVAHPRILSSNPWHLTRLVWIAELSLIPASNNVVALITWRTGLDLYPVLAAALYAYIGVRHLRVLPFGFVWSRHSVAVGAIAGLALALPPMIFFLHPLFVSSVGYGPIANMSINGLLRRVMIDLPFLTAIIEELVFRHWLFFEAKSPIRTILFNASIFTAWHGIAAFTAVAATQYGSSAQLLLLSYVGSLGAVFVGGVVFALVRHLTGSFVYSALAHWLTDAGLIVVIWTMAHVGH